VSAATSREAGSFRDPSGFVFRQGGVLLRQVNPAYRQPFELLMSTGRYAELAGRGDLVRHEELDASAFPSAYRVLRPAVIDTISYPYEWCFSQLKEAALLTLRIQSAALAKGMALKDASAYNVQFGEGGKPVFIDTLSFDPYVEGQPWVAYGQFCRHFLAPLSLMSKVDVRLGQLSRLHLDGVPLDLAASLLPLKSKFSLGLGLHIFGQAASQKKHESAGSSGAASLREVKVGRRQLEGLLDNLKSTVEGLTWNPGGTEWADYYAANNNYDAAALDAKAALLRGLLGEVNPKSVWDLGGNTGRFSRVAAALGAKTVCWDIDPSCVEANYRHVRQNNEANLLPLLSDLTNPSPGQGWAHSERMSVADRGPVDAVLALGLIHHLAISNNLPLEHVAAYFAKLGRTLIIEFVPKADSQVKKLLATRPDIFPEYTPEGFLAAFSKFCRVEKSIEIPGTVRTLHRMTAP
jgi:hypothetical protein